MQPQQSSLLSAIYVILTPLKIVDFSVFSSYMLTDGSVSLKTFVSLPDFAFVSGLKGLKEFDFSYFATIFVAYVRSHW